MAMTPEELALRTYNLLLRLEVLLRTAGPLGASTAANQVSEIALLTSITAQMTALQAQFPTTLGQKVMATSTSVVIASNQSAIPITGSITATNPSVGLNGVAIPTSSTLIGGSDGVLLQAGRSFDLDTGIGVEWDLGVSLRLPSSGGSVAGGTSTNPLRTDPTGVTTQPVSFAGGVDVTDRVARDVGRVRLRNPGNTVDVGDATNPVRVDPTGTTTQPVSGTVTANQGGGAWAITAVSLPLPTGAAQEHATAGSPLSARLSDGAAFYNAPAAGQLPSALVGGRLSVDGSGVTQPISASTLPIPTGASTLAEQQTQTTSLQLIDNLPHAMNAAFSNAAAIAGQLDDTSTTAATEDNIAPVRITAQRGLHTNLRNAAGAELATSGAPLRVDPTGTTAQPITDNSGSLTVDAPVGTPVASRLSDGAAFLTTSGGRLAVDASGVAVPVTDNAGSLTVDSVQLPAALVGGRLDENVGAWLGSTAPTVGQKVMASGLPVSIASDQTVIPVNDNSGSLTVDSPGLPTALGQSTAANSMRVVVASDQVVIPISDNAGSLTVDTTQLPAALVGGRLDDNVGSWMGATTPTVGQKTMVASLPVTLASDQSTITIQGQQSARTAGTITSATSVIGPVACTNLNVASVTLSAAALFSGVGFLFEASDDGGATYGYVLQGARTDLGIIESNPKGLSDSNAPRAWDIAIGGFTHFRVRATGWTSGTANLAVTLQAMPYEPAPSVGLSQVGGVSVAAGQSLMAASLPVVVASDQATIPVVITDRNGYAPPARTVWSASSMIVPMSAPLWAPGRTVWG